jgi:hypothetical protein
MAFRNHHAESFACPVLFFARQMRYRDARSRRERPWRNLRFWVRPDV